MSRGRSAADYFLTIIDESRQVCRGLFSHTNVIAITKTWDCRELPKGAAGDYEKIMIRSAVKVPQARTEVNQGRRIDCRCRIHEIPSGCGFIHCPRFLGFRVDVWVRLSEGFAYAGPCHDASNVGGQIKIGEWWK
jgi:hypothetical protein